MTVLKALATLLCASLLTGSFGLFAQTNAQADPNTLFFESVAAYNKKDLPQAQELLTKYLALRPNDAHAHLNMATLQVKLKNWGMAQAHFQSARSLNPQLEGLDELETALSNNAPGANGLRGPFYRIILPLVTSLNSTLILIVALLTFTAFGHLLVSHLKRRKWARTTEEAMPTAKWTLPVFGGLCLCMLLLYGVQIWMSSIHLGTIVRQNAQVFSAPDPESFELGTLGIGADVKILKDTQGWVQITNGAELSGWIPEKDVMKHRKN